MFYSDMNVLLKQKENDGCKLILIKVIMNCRSFSSALPSVCYSKGCFGGRACLSVWPKCSWWRNCTSVSSCSIYR